MAHPLHELAQVGPALRRPGVPGVAQIVEPELRRKTRLLDALAPHRLEVRPPQGRPLCPTKRDRSTHSENRCMCSRSTGTTGSGIATVRLPAADFGGPSAIRPLSSLSDRRTRTDPARRSTSPWVSPISSPHRRLLDTARRTSACHRSGMAAANACTCAGVATGGSGLDSAPAPLIRHGLRRISSSEEGRRPPPGTCHLWAESAWPRS